VLTWCVCFNPFLPALTPSLQKTSYGAAHTAARLASSSAKAMQVCPIHGAMNLIKARG